MVVVRCVRPVKPPNTVRGLHEFSAAVERQAVFCAIAARMEAIHWTFFHEGKGSGTQEVAVAIAYVTSEYAPLDIPLRAAHFAALLVSLFYRGFRGLAVTCASREDRDRVRSYLDAEQAAAFVWVLSPVSAKERPKETTYSAGGIE